MSSRRGLVKVADRISALGVIAPPPIHIEAPPTFEGSLGKLFECVRERRIDLAVIPLFPICEAYFLYLANLGEEDLDTAAAALHALAYLLERKAFLLLPIPESAPEELDETPELEPPSVARYREAIDLLETWREARESLFFRSPDAGPAPYELPYSLANVSAGDLARAFERVLRRANPAEMPQTNRRLRSLEDQMRIVLSVITFEQKRLTDLVQTPYTREEVVYWFLALLELIRLGQVATQAEGEEVFFARSSLG